MWRGATVVERRGYGGTGRSACATRNGRGGAHKVNEDDLLLDNYELFTYNLAQYLGQMGQELEVRRNDQITLEEIEQRRPERILISPGPCTPHQAGISISLIQRFGIKGEAGKHAVVFKRGESLIALAPRLVIGLHEDWRDTTLEMPPGTWRNELTNETVPQGNAPLSILRQISRGATHTGGKPMTQSFSVWAPLPKKVEVQVGADRFPMAANPDGWWTAVIPKVKPGVDYGFILDGAGPLPDPRSHCQPYGIDGPSRLTDHGEFQWTDENWQAPPLSSAVIYELHVGTFHAPRHVRSRH